MSLTSTELNYLVWRYLQESGFELAAFALDKHTRCSHYEHEGNTSIIASIEPGTLVNLVQKGILLSLVEEEASGETENSERLTLFSALLKEQRDKAQSGEQDSIESKKRFLLKSEIQRNGTDNDVEMAEPDLNGHDISNSNSHTSNNEINNLSNDTTTENATNNDKPNDDSLIGSNSIVITTFSTQLLEPVIRFEESLVSEWHPGTEVFAYGKNDSSAVINAIKDGAVLESVTLVHPNISNIPNEINVVSWAPQGNMIVTAGANGELRAWSPDGKLKNVANLLSDEIPVTSTEIAHQEPRDVTKRTSVITNLLWNESGQLLLSIDSHNQVSLWDGNTLTLIKQINPPLPPADNVSVIAACWLNDDKFALSTVKNSIKIYSISTQQFGLVPQLDVQTIGFLHGHENSISFLRLNQKSKLLASCSDFDYLVKVWSRGSSQESLDLNVVAKEDVKLHTSPIVALEWLQELDDVSILLSVSMEGVLNIWNCTTGESLISSDLFNNTENFKFQPEDEKLKFTRDLLIFDAALSPNQRFLALGDDFGRVTIWDVDLSRYSPKSPKNFVRCLGLYNFTIPETAEENESKTPGIGICDVKWDSESKNISVSYSGAESVVLKWR
ncbi:WD40-repeat-containing domain protein [Scheffersomyces xylosifermentans]|uniref:WD40-repeat-containing domain protein n=1 Tax=Scheffersomyces xylosifermentans TaxID=1304137 RepID=UPI00315D398B